MVTGRTISKECLLTIMENGDIGLAFHNEPIAHMDKRTADAHAYVVMYEDVDVPIRHDECLVEKIPEGWLIDGVLYHAICQGPCHDW